MIRNKRLTPEEAAFVELAVGHPGSPLPGCRHRFEYRLACVVRGVWAFSGPLQTYPGNWWAFAGASKGASPREVRNKAKIKAKYYSSEIHEHAFVPKGFYDRLMKRELEW